ncbi:DUF6220 domain-containing protein [Bacillus gobiensis]|uniref:DUF6220 domain-containing protein n=1 Tax=Bacillus gobiensis TaxID=1441095 RepID=UPI003D1BC3D6
MRFARYFFFLPLVMAALSFSAQSPRTNLWRSFGLFGMVILLFFTAAISPRVDFLGALHPVITLFLFWNCMKIIQSLRYKRNI